MIQVLIIQKFCPELILVSAGFDAHIEDPLSEINLVDRFFYKFAVIIVYLCRKFYCSAGLILEGGYNCRATARSVLGIISAFLDSNLWNNIKNHDELMEFLNTDIKDAEKIMPQNLRNFENIKKTFNI